MPWEEYERWLAAIEGARRAESPQALGAGMALGEEMVSELFALASSPTHRVRFEAALEALRRLETITPRAMVQALRQAIGEPAAGLEVRLPGVTDIDALYRVLDELRAKPVLLPTGEVITPEFRDRLYAYRDAIKGLLDNVRGLRRYEGYYREYARLAQRNRLAGPMADPRDVARELELYQFLERQGALTVADRLSEDLAEVLRRYPDVDQYLGQSIYDEPLAAVYARLRAANRARREIANWFDLLQQPLHAGQQAIVEAVQQAGSRALEGIYGEIRAERIATLRQLQQRQAQLMGRVHAALEEILGPYWSGGQPGYGRGIGPRPRASASQNLVWRALLREGTVLPAPVNEEVLARLAAVRQAPAALKGQVLASVLEGRPLPEIAAERGRRLAQDLGYRQQARIAYRQYRLALRELEEVGHRIADLSVYEPQLAHGEVTGLPWQIEEHIEEATGAESAAREAASIADALREQEEVAREVEEARLQAGLTEAGGLEAARRKVAQRFALMDPTYWAETAKGEIIRGAQPLWREAPEEWRELARQWQEAAARGAPIRIAGSAVPYEITALKPAEGVVAMRPRSRPAEEVLVQISHGGLARQTETGTLLRRATIAGQEAAVVAYEAADFAGLKERVAWLLSGGRAEIADPAKLASLLAGGRTEEELYRNLEQLALAVAPWARRMEGSELSNLSYLALIDALSGRQFDLQLARDLMTIEGLLRDEAFRSEYARSLLDRVFQHMGLQNEYSSLGSLLQYIRENLHVPTPEGGDRPLTDAEAARLLRDALGDLAEGPGTRHLTHLRRKEVLDILEATVETGAFRPGRVQVDISRLAELGEVEEEVVRALRTRQPILPPGVRRLEAEMIARGDVLNVGQAEPVATASARQEVMRAITNLAELAKEGPADISAVCRVVNRALKEVEGEIGKTEMDLLMEAAMRAVRGRFAEPGWTDFMRGLSVRQLRDLIELERISGGRLSLSFWVPTAEGMAPAAIYRGRRKGELVGEDLFTGERFLVGRGRAITASMTSAPALVRQEEVLEPPAAVGGPVLVRSTGVAFRELTGAHATDLPDVTLSAFGRLRALEEGRKVVLAGFDWETTTLRGQGLPFYPTELGFVADVLTREGGEYRRRELVRAQVLVRPSTEVAETVNRLAATLEEQLRAGRRATLRQNEFEFLRNIAKFGDVNALRIRAAAAGREGVSLAQAAAQQLLSATREGLGRLEREGVGIEAVLGALGRAIERVRRVGGEDVVVFGQNMLGAEYLWTRVFAGMPGALATARQVSRMLEERLAGQDLGRQLQAMRHRTERVVRQLQTQLAEGAQAVVLKQSDFELARWVASQAVPEMRRVRPESTYRPRRGAPVVTLSVADARDLLHVFEDTGVHYRLGAEGSAAGRLLGATVTLSKGQFELARTVGAIADAGLAELEPAWEYKGTVTLGWEAAERLSRSVRAGIAAIQEGRVDIEAALPLLTPGRRRRAEALVGTLEAFFSQPRVELITLDRLMRAGRPGSAAADVQYGRWLAGTLAGREELAAGAGELVRSLGIGQAVTHRSLEDVVTELGILYSHLGRELPVPADFRPLREGAYVARVVAPRSPVAYVSAEEGRPVREVFRYEGIERVAGEGLASGYALRLARLAPAEGGGLVPTGSVERLFAPNPVELSRRFHEQFEVLPSAEEAARVQREFVEDYARREVIRAARSPRALGEFLVWQQYGLPGAAEAKVSRQPAIILARGLVGAARRVRAGETVSPAEELLFGAGLPQTRDVSALPEVESWSREFFIRELTPVRAGRLRQGSWPLVTQWLESPEGGAYRTILEDIYRFRALGLLKEPPQELLKRAEEVRGELIQAAGIEAPTAPVRGLYTLGTFRVGETQTPELTVRATTAEQIRARIEGFARRLERKAGVKTADTLTAIARELKTRGLVEKTVADVGSLTAAVYAAALSGRLPQARVEMRHVPVFATPELAEQFVQEVRRRAIYPALPLVTPEEAETATAEEIERRIQAHPVYSLRAARYQQALEELGERAVLRFHPALAPHVMTTGMTPPEPAVPVGAPPELIERLVRGAEAIRQRAGEVTWQALRESNLEQAANTLYDRLFEEVYAEQQPTWEALGWGRAGAELAEARIPVLTRATRGAYFRRLAEFAPEELEGLMTTLGESGSPVVRRVAGLIESYLEHAPGSGADAVAAVNEAVKQEAVAGAGSTVSVSRTMRAVNEEIRRRGAAQQLASRSVGEIAAGLVGSATRNWKLLAGLGVAAAGAAVLLRPHDRERYTQEGAPYRPRAAKPPALAPAEAATPYNRPVPVDEYSGLKVRIRGRTRSGVDAEALSQAVGQAVNDTLGINTNVNVHTQDDRAAVDERFVTDVFGQLLKYGRARV